MSRACYSEELDQWQLIRWRGAVESALRGARGQAFLKEMLTALDALPEKRLIAEELEADGEVCALGSVGKLRRLDMAELDPEDYESLAQTFGIAEAMVREIEYVNDEWLCRRGTPEKRFRMVREWVVEHISAERMLIR